MAQKKLDDAQKQELIQRLKELREVLRQEGQGGEERKQRLQRFGEQARGQRPGDGPDGQPGQVRQGQMDVRAPAWVAATVASRSRVCRRAKRKAPAQATPGKQGSDGDGDEPGDRAYGNGHDSDTSPATPRTSTGEAHDVSAAGIDSGEGTASAEVIYGAAQRGFVGKGYKDIFTEYQSVAEQVIDKDEIPPGYRFYVRRYFQLIRPRE